jgi:DNA-binding transcriptional ArsR family regulator
MTTKEKPMKRDMDLIRRIVLAVQDLPLGKGYDTEVLNGLEGVDPLEFAAHVQLLEEAGLVEAALQGKGKQIPSFAVVFRLTWAGHEFADSIRDDTLWKKAKDHVLKPSASWTFAALGEFLKAGIRAQLDLPG